VSYRQQSSCRSSWPRAPPLREFPFLQHLGKHRHAPSPFIEVSRLCNLPVRLAEGTPGAKSFLSQYLHPRYILIPISSARKACLGESLAPSRRAPVRGRPAYRCSHRRPRHRVRSQEQRGTWMGAGLPLRGEQRLGRVPRGWWVPRAHAPAPPVSCSVSYGCAGRGTSDRPSTAAFAETHDQLFLHCTPPLERTAEPQRFGKESS
jgi:hypothetical protein